MKKAGGCEWTKIFCFKHRLRISRHFGAGAPGWIREEPILSGRKGWGFFSQSVFNAIIK